MKKVLIIAYHFFQEDIGAMRVRGLAKYLSEFGWEPTILTPKIDSGCRSNVRTVKTPDKELFSTLKAGLKLDSNKSVISQFDSGSYKNGNKLLHVINDISREVFAYPDVNIGWYSPAVKTGVKLLNQENFDIIISSSGPNTAHLVANRLVKKFKIPWIADFRDLWTQNHYYRYSPIRNAFEKRLELKTISLSSALTTVSLPLAEKLQQLHKGKEIYSVLNGFDPDQMNPGSTLIDNFNITYTGQLYQGRRDPEPLLKVIRELIDEGIVDPKDFRLDFYGNYEKWLDQLIAAYRLNDIVKLHGSVTRIESINKQRSSQLLLLLTWNDPSEVGVYTGKIFDYLASQRPILSMGSPKGVVAELLRETQAGVHVLNESEIRKQMVNYYEEYIEKGSVHYSGIHSKIEKYSHREMTKQFNTIMNKLVDQ